MMVALSANMPETATPRKFSVEGEPGTGDDDRGIAEDGSLGESGASAVHVGVQAQDPARGRRVQTAGGAGRATPTGGAVLVAPVVVARGARQERPEGARTEEAGTGA